MKNQSIKEYINNFNNGQYNSKDVGVQCDAGWYDWFCKDSSLRNKTYSLTAKLKQIVASPKVNQDTMYVFFKNNCPCVGKLYDDFRICDMVTGDVIYTICPAVGYTKTFGQSEVWGKENDFKEALVAGTWNDVLFFFTGVDQKKVQEEKKLLKALEAEKKAMEKVVADKNKIKEFIMSRNKEVLYEMLIAALGNNLTKWAKETGIIK
jgi:histone deacetylase complex regulatory component SIN3